MHSKGGGPCRFSREGTKKGPQGPFFWPKERHRALPSPSLSLSPAIKNSLSLSSASCTGAAASCTGAAAACEELELELELEEEEELELELEEELEEELELEELSRTFRRVNLRRSIAT